MASKWDDLQEQLQGLGYGNQWDQQKAQLSQRQAIKRASDIERLNEYNRRNPQKHKQAVKRAHAKRKQRAEQLFTIAQPSGGLKCARCQKKLTVTDLFNGKCGKCKETIYNADFE